MFAVFLVYQLFVLVPTLAHPQKLAAWDTHRPVDTLVDTADACNAFETNHHCVDC
jgi:hypothetical protein